MKKVSFDYRCGNQRGITVSTEQVIRDLPEFTDQFQNAYSENGLYQPIPNNYWTCGFWTGEIWLAYEYSQDERLKKRARFR